MNPLRLIALACAILSLATLASAEEPHPAVKPDPAKGQFIVFVHPGRSPLAQDFQSVHVPELQKLAEKMGAEWRTVDVSGNGAPAEIAVTPLLVFQNYKGRSIFQGRYADHDKVGHFIRTSRNVPQGNAPNVKEKLPVLQLGRAVVASPVKITPLQDVVPPNFDQAAFHERARAALSRGFTRFKEADRVALRRTDRLFYMDFYPFGTDDGNLAISLALFSQFNCHEPVYTDYSDTVYGKMETMDALFAKAAGLLEAEVLRQIAESRLGDGFDPIDSGAPVTDWKALGLALPPAPEGMTSSAKSAQPLVTDWVIDPTPIEDTPPLQFNFPAPLDNYTGSSSQMSGVLKLAPGLKLVGATGSVQVPTMSVTMGEKELDDTVHDSISAVIFGTSRFTLKEVVAPEDTPLVYGDIRQFLGKGDFTLKGITVPMDVRAEITPTADEAGAPRLQVSAEFELRLKALFGIEGPPGPDPANDTLQFRLNFNMKPK